MAKEFTLFPQLITELRLEIWRFALPDPPPIRPLFRYKEGCWVIEELGPVPWEDPDPNGENLQARFDTSQLEPLHIPVPLYSVNREARGVAIKYLSKHRLVASLNRTQYGFEIVRHFDPQIDTIFLPAADAYVFGGEPGDRFHVPEMFDRYVSWPYVALPRLATTLSGFEILKKDSLDAFLTTGGMIKILYVVDVAPTSTLTLQDIDNTTLFPLVGLEDTFRARLFWSSSRREWTASGDDVEARVRLTQMVAGLETLGTYPGDDDWDVQLVYLTTP
jgi:hypothetical protein